ncbi:ComF family protein [Pontibacillus salipaludis]|uniref:ComF operon protein 3 n=1 Tax=Pontibacillus salipaludis TaxID=1697394 RepID=A0ABQ1Q386_9BACI|nr:ComF family protein [Pontibacillus salipaludis]GGD10784.1 ComF operon protein 3 [Pontibacillus salipaludis]
MHCLWCDQEIIKDLNWNNLFQLPRDEVLCEGCKKEMHLLKGPYCPKCSRETDGGEVCHDCTRWGEAPLEKNTSLYRYNTFLKEMIAKWKYRGDYILVDIFKEDFRKWFKALKISKGAVLVPIPLSEERFTERGFNQSESLARLLPLETANPLHRVHSEKQSKKSRFDRMTTENPFTITTSITQPVVLIDDIYTTGRTLQHAAKLLKEAGAPSVVSFTLIRS